MRSESIRCDRVNTESLRQNRTSPQNGQLQGRTVTENPNRGCCQLSRKIAQIFRALIQFFSRLFRRNQEVSNSTPKQGVGRSTVENKSALFIGNSLKFHMGSNEGGAKFLQGGDKCKISHFTDMDVPYVDLEKFDFRSKTDEGRIQEIAEKLHSHAVRNFDYNYPYMVQNLNFRIEIGSVQKNVRIKISVNNNDSKLHDVTFSNPRP